MFGKKLEESFQDIFGGHDDEQARRENYLKRKPYRLSITVDGKQKIINGTTYQDCINSANKFGVWTFDDAWRNQ